MENKFPPAQEVINILSNYLSLYSLCIRTYNLLCSGVGRDNCHSFTVLTPLLIRLHSTIAAHRFLVLFGLPFCFQNVTNADGTHIRTIPFVSLFT